MCGVFFSPSLSAHPRVNTRCINIKHIPGVRGCVLLYVNLVYIIRVLLLLYIPLLVTYKLLVRTSCPAHGTSTRHEAENVSINTINILIWYTLLQLYCFTYRRGIRFSFSSCNPLPPLFHRLVSIPTTLHCRVVLRVNMNININSTALRQSFSAWFWVVS